MRERAAILGILFPCLALLHCQKGPAPDGTVAEIDGRTVSASALEEYLEDNLVSATPEEPEAHEEMDRVKSRLLDNLVDEELLCAEAERRGIRVTEEDLEAQPPEGVDSAEEPLPKNTAGTRRQLLVQKLREADARAHATISASELEAYVRKNAEALRGKQRIRLRSLRFGDSGRADRVRRELLSKRLDFDKAAESLHGASGEDAAISVALDGLPGIVRKAVEGLAPGQLSEPVNIDGTTFLFLVERDPRTPAAEGQSLEELGRSELTEAKYREASKELLARLRGQARVVVHEENLSFRYVPDSTRRE